MDGGGSCRRCRVDQNMGRRKYRWQTDAGWYAYRRGLPSGCMTACTASSSACQTALQCTLHMTTKVAQLYSNAGKTTWHTSSCERSSLCLVSQSSSFTAATVQRVVHMLAGRTSSTVGEEKQHNLRLTKSKEDFITIMANLGLPYPKKIGVSSTMKQFWECPSPCDVICV